MTKRINEKQLIVNRMFAENQPGTREKKEKQKKTSKTREQSQLCRNPVIDNQLKNNNWTTGCT